MEASTTNGMEKVVCDICGADAGEPFLKLSNRPEGENRDIVKCSQCGLVYFNPRRLKNYVCAEVGEYFDVTQNLDGFRYMYSVLAKWAVPPGRFLDVGCGPGYMLDIARAHGWKTLGVEPRKSFIEVARKYLKLEIMEGYLGVAPIEPGSMDVISMTEVIEHVPSPTRLLAEAAKVLSAQGRLFLTTPNIESSGFKELGENWTPQINSEEHIYYFSPDTLTKALAKAGLAPVEIFTNGVRHKDEQILAVAARAEQVDKIRADSEFLKYGDRKIARYERLKKNWFFGPLVRLGDHIVNYPKEDRRSKKKSAKKKK